MAVIITPSFILSHILVSGIGSDQASSLASLAVEAVRIVSSSIFPSCFF